MNAQLIPRDEQPTPGTALAATPSDLLAMAVSQGADLDKLERLMELKERHEANEARKAYHEAVAAFKANPPKVYRDKENKQYGSRYTSLANMVNTVNSALSVHGLSARWETDQSNQIKVTCILSHVLGHSESVSLSGPPDKSGAKNSLQEIKSTLTYLKLATFELVTGVASEEGNLDDDGNGAGASDDDGPGPLQAWFDAIESAADIPGLKKVKAEMIAAVGNEQGRAPLQLTRAYNAKVKELTQAGAAK